MTAWRVSDEQLNSLIERFGNDLTQRALDGKTDPVIGRDEEVDQMITILLQRGRSNVVLLGGPGVGKTAAFVALARQIVFGKVPRLLQNARVIEADLTAMAAGSTSRADYEGRLIPFVKGIAERNASKTQPPIIICIDEMHTLMPNCPASSVSGTSDLLKPHLTAGHLRVVGATTVNEYTDYVKPDGAVDRRFQKINLREPTPEETIIIMTGLKSVYEKHFQLTIDDALLKTIVTLTGRYLRNRNNPDKSILLLDAACAYAAKYDKTALDEESITTALATEAGVSAAALRG